MNLSANRLSVSLILPCLLLSFTAFVQLPALPRLDDFAPAIKTQIQKAYAAAKARPRDAAIIGKLGMTLQAYEEQAAAAQCYELARTLAPNEFQWTYYAGIAESKSGETEKALALLQAAVRLRPDYLPAQIRLADAYFEMKQNDKAETLYAAVTVKNPSSVLAWYGLGRVRAAGKNHTEAIHCLKQAISLSPTFGAAHYALAISWRDTGSLDQAREHLALYQQHRLIRPASDDVFLSEITALNLSAQEYLNKGLALEAIGNLPDSITAHEKALEINPNLTQAHINLLQLYARLRQPDKAAQHYQRALEINPRAADAHYNFGVLMLSEQKLQEATAAFTKALQTNPQYTEAHHNLGLILMQSGKLNEAAREFELALISNPNYRATHFELGRILVHQGKADEAIAHFTQILTPEDQNTPRYLYALAATHIRAGRRTEGLQWLQRAKTLAVKYAQQDLLASIERDLKTLEENK
jgi:superkiller protein 3